MLFLESLLSRLLQNYLAFMCKLPCKKIAKFDNVKKIIVCSRYQYCMYRYIETTCTYYTWKTSIGAQKTSYISNQSEYIQYLEPCIEFIQHKTHRPCQVCHVRRFRLQSFLENLKVCHPLHSKFVTDDVHLQGNQIILSIVLWHWRKSIVLQKNNSISVLMNKHIFLK